MPDSALLTVLARSFTDGESSVPQIVARAARVLGRSWRWLPPLARRYVEAFGGKARPRQREVLRFLRDDVGFGEALAKYLSQLAVEQWLGHPQIMQPVEAAKAWNLPYITTTAALADWLGLRDDELVWFADLKGLLSRDAKRSALLHYHYRVLAKSFDSVRLIEAPKPRLKQLQRKILTTILERIPPHPVAHGFVKSRSIRTFVAPHVGRRVVLKMDLRDFFPSIGVLSNCRLPRACRGSARRHLYECGSAGPMEIDLRGDPRKAARSEGPVFTPALAARCAIVAGTCQSLRVSS
jgi:RNA-directed DNA polymerase